MDRNRVSTHGARVIRTGKGWVRADTDFRFQIPDSKLQITDFGFHHPVATAPGSDSL